MTLSIIPILNILKFKSYYFLYTVKNNLQI